jgi:hypothetical protein
VANLVFTGFGSLVIRIAITVRNLTLLPMMPSSRSSTSFKSLFVVLEFEFLLQADEIVRRRSMLGFALLLSGGKSSYLA